MLFAYSCAGQSQSEFEAGQSEFEALSRRRLLTFGIVDIVSISEFMVQTACGVKLAGALGCATKP